MGIWGAGGVFNASWRAVDLNALLEKLPGGSVMAVAHAYLSTRPSPPCRRRRCRCWTAPPPTRRGPARTAATWAPVRGTAARQCMARVLQARVLQALTWKQLCPPPPR